MPTIKILLIEDDEDDYILTRSVLEDSRPLKYNLTWLTDYEAGLAAVQRLEHDICLLDYRLGARTGLDFLCTFRWFHCGNSSCLRTLIRS